MCSISEMAAQCGFHLNMGPVPPVSPAYMARLVLPIRSRPFPSRTATASAPQADTATVVAVQPEEPRKPSKNGKKKTKKAAPLVVTGTTAAPVVVGGGGDRFTNQYGANFAALEPWVRLCRDLGVDGPLNSKTQCKKALETIHVNIRDFLDAIDKRALKAAKAAVAADAEGADAEAARAAVLAKKVKVRTFDSEWQLSAYTISERKVYSRREIRANKEHPLRLLMAHIRSPKGGKARRGAIGC